MDTQNSTKTKHKHQQRHTILTNKTIKNLTTPYNLTFFKHKKRQPNSIKTRYNNCYIIEEKTKISTQSTRKTKKHSTTF